MSSTKEMFLVPEEYIDSTPCITNSQIFTDPALDVDTNDEDWLDLGNVEQNILLQKKEEAEARAKIACSACPVLSMCREADEKATVKAFGVVAGRTYEERTGTVPVVEEVIPRGPMGQVRDDLIEEWTRVGLSNAIIAQKLGCHPRTVERRKVGLASGSVVRYNGAASGSQNTAESRATLLTNISEVGKPKVAKRVADNPLQPSRVTPETAFIYNLLIDGEFHDRSAILDLTLPHVDSEVAFNRAPKDRTYASHEARIKIGARKFLMNRIDIAVRSGRINEVTAKDGTKLIAMEPNTIKVWKAWTASVAVK